MNNFLHFSDKLCIKYNEPCFSHLQMCFLKLDSCCFTAGRWRSTLQTDPYVNIKSSKFENQNIGQKTIRTHTLSRRYETPLSSISGTDASPGPVSGPDLVHLLSLGFSLLHPQLLHCVFILQVMCVFCLVRNAIELVYRFLRNKNKQAKKVT